MKYGTLARTPNTTMHYLVPWLILQLLAVAITIGLALITLCFVRRRAMTIAVGGVALALLVYHQEGFYCKPAPVTPSSIPTAHLFAAAGFVSVFIVLHAIMVYLAFDSNFLAVLLLVWVPLASLTLASNLLVCYVPDLVLAPLL